MIRYYAVHMAGPYHLDSGLPCQDSFFVKRDPGGVVYASAADGLGSESRSDVGARIAARQACEHCMAHYKSGMPFSQVKKIMNNAFVYAYKAVLTQAQADGQPAGEYDTTLCMVIFDGGHVFYGQSGDSGILALLRSGEYVPLTRQQRDEDGCVYPLCCGPDMWVFGEAPAPVSAVMLMTDGVWEQVCPPLLRRRDVPVNVPLAGKFMDRRETSLKAVKKLRAAAAEYLKNYPRWLLDDDKTAVVIYDPLQPAQRMPAEYYRAPDWEALQRAAQAKLYADAPCAQEEADGAPRDEANAPAEQAQTGAEESPPAAKAQADADESPPAAKAQAGADESPPAAAKPPEDADGSAPAEPRPQKDAPRSAPAEPKPPEDAPRSAPAACAGQNARAQKAHARGPRKAGALCLRAALPAKLYDLAAVLLLAAFSAAAFAMSGFVKAHASETYLGIFLVCFVANATVLLPAPSLLVVLQYSMLLHPAAVALAGALGASLGEMVGFLAGAHGGRFAGGRLSKKLKALLPRRPYGLVFAFSALPLPLFDVVGMTAGAARLPALPFYLACLAGKLLKMLALVWAGQAAVNFLHG